MTGPIRQNLRSESELQGLKEFVGKVLPHPPRKRTVMSRYGLPVIKEEGVYAFHELGNFCANKGGTAEETLFRPCDGRGLFFI